MAFSCTICGQVSTSICVSCTKDTCDDHLCILCKSCSDCCPHEVRLDEHREARPTVRETLEHATERDATPHESVPG